MAKIMLVEDDNNLREIYEARLQAEGYTIVAAHDGEEALVMAKAEKPDLIISDVMMPKISGFEMLDILRNTDGLKDVKVIMLTALGQSDDQQRADKLGADRYLVKSQVTLEDIVKTAHDLLGDSQAAPQAAAPAPAAVPAPTTAPEPIAAPPAAPAPAPVEPSAASAPPTPAAPQAASDTAPSTAPPVSTAAASDDKVMAEAVDSLIADTDKQAAETAPKSEAKDEAKEEKPAEPETADTTKTDDDDEEDVSNSHVTVAGKKVIQPIDTGPEKDLDVLLAEEEAKEAAEAPGATAEPVEPPLPELDPSRTNKVAGTTADEEASVEAKIEDFVAGATTEADTPNPAPSSASNAAPEAPTAPAAPASEPKTPAITPITVSEDLPAGAPSASLSGNPGVPPAPAADGGKTPPDPSTIAL
jgi:CheY-like chemotaxis protein